MLLNQQAHVMCKRHSYNHETMSWHREIYFLLSRKHTLLKATKLQAYMPSTRDSPLQILHFCNLWIFHMTRLSKWKLLLCSLIFIFVKCIHWNMVYNKCWFVPFLLHPLIKSYLHNNHTVNGCRDISTVNGTVTYIATQQHIQWMLHGNMRDDTKPRLFCERLDASSAQTQEFTLRTLTQLSKKKSVYDSKECFL